MDCQLMSKEFNNDKGISDGTTRSDICDKDGETNENIQRVDQVRKIMIEFG